MPTPILTIAGLWNSGPQHWQTHWEAKHGWKRVQQSEWERPEFDDWASTLDEAIRACDEPPVLAAHSLGCALIARWGAQPDRPSIRGAFLVGPSDVDAPSYPEGTTGFKPMPLSSLRFPTLVIASTNDEYVSVDRAKEFAAAWGSKIHFIGDAGHINGASGYGPWPEGETLLLDFVREVS